ncbi:hypothetical protein KP509_06G032100 [Ceratopteris richardii]|nr:hypothetical protein KP509_06G032100 [Ceratopteris richardii]
MLTSSCTGTDTPLDAYSKVFLEADFRGDPCYQALIGFFDLLFNGATDLPQDQVRWLWMDALCINQTDLVEKSREIANMAAYYKFSRGCYVLAHGVDQGFKLWKDSSQSGHREAFPRWFFRVWTLQEFLLPSRVTFLVEGLSTATIEKLDRILFTEVPRLCRKCKRTLAYVEDQIYHDKRRCEWCGYGIFTKASTDGVYYVEGNVLFHLILIELDANTRQYRNQSFGRKLIEVYRSMEIMFRAPDLVIKEIAERDCSIEEDRVLSILGLICNDSQLDQNRKRNLRAGKSLSDQIVTLTKLLEDDALVCLAIMDWKGFYGAVGISWAPDFCSNLWRTCPVAEILHDDIHKYFERTVERSPDTDCSDPDGALRLIGKASSIRMRIPFSKVRNPDLFFSDIPLCRYGGEPSSSMHLACRNASVDLVKQMQSRILELKIETIYPGGILVCMDTQKLNEHQVLSGDDSYLEFDMWWVQMGISCLDGVKERKCNIVMVCINMPGHGLDVQNQKETQSEPLELVKIGVLTLDEAVSSLVFRDSTTRMFTVGGVTSTPIISFASPITLPDFLCSLDPSPDESD